VTDEDVDRQVDRLREQTGELSDVNRPARDGDYLSIDLHGSRPAGDDVHVDDYLYELGSGSDVPGLDDQLRGAKPGDILQFSAPDADSPSGLADASFRVLVKEVKEKTLPEPTDEWAAEASEFSTLEELRADLRSRLKGLKVLQAQLALRDRAVEALVALVEDEPPDVLVDAEVRERLHDLGHRLEGRHMTFEQFLQASGRDEATLLADLRGEAARAVQLDLALRALGDAEGLEVTEEELETTLSEMAQQAGTTEPELRSRLERAGRLPAVRSDRRKAKALAWLLDNVELVDEEGDPVSRDALRADVATGSEPENTQADQPGERGSEYVGAQEGATVEAEA
jgi:trigger factor